MNTIYTIGYSGIQQADLVGLVRQLDLMVLDIRYRAGSRKPDWNKSALVNVLGERYVHVRELGNVNYRLKDAEVKLLDQDIGIKRATDFLLQRSIILLCACSDVETCHRKIVAEQLSNVVGTRIVHLNPASVAIKSLHQASPLSPH
jgi:uncharacterized protein (DUF488 family)